MDFDREAYTRKYEEDQIKFWSSLPSREPYTDEEFDNLEQVATAKYTDMRENGKAGYVTLMDMFCFEWNSAARDVNPGEHWKVWNSTKPCYYDTWVHNAKYNNQANFFINKALACGYAKTAAEAVKWFDEHR